MSRSSRPPRPSSRSLASSPGSTNSTNSTKQKQEEDIIDDHGTLARPFERFALDDSLLPGAPPGLPALPGPRRADLAPGRADFPAGGLGGDPTPDPVRGRRIARVIHRAPELILERSRRTVFHYEAVERRVVNIWESRESAESTEPENEER